MGYRGYAFRGYDPTVDGANPTRYGAWGYFCANYSNFTGDSMPHATENANFFGTGLLPAPDNTLMWPEIQNDDITNFSNSDFKNIVSVGPSGVATQLTTGLNGTGQSVLLRWPINIDADSNPVVGLVIGIPSDIDQTRFYAGLTSATSLSDADTRYLTLSVNSNPGYERNDIGFYYDGSSDNIIRFLHGTGSATTASTLVSSALDATTLSGGAAVLLQLEFDTTQGTCDFSITNTETNANLGIASASTNLPTGDMGLVLGVRGVGGLSSFASGLNVYSGFVGLRPNI